MSGSRLWASRLEPFVLAEGTCFVFDPLLEVPPFARSSL